MTHGVCNRQYTPPNTSNRPTRKALSVDEGLDFLVLNRLNRLPRVKVYSVCAGHLTGKGDRHASVIFQGRSLNAFAPYLKRCGSTEYEPIVTYYNVQWHMEIRCDAPGEAPLRWWHRLVDVLEENPDCSAWMDK